MQSVKYPLNGKRRIIECTNQEIWNVLDDTAKDRVRHCVIVRRESLRDSIITEYLMSL